MKIKNLTEHFAISIEPRKPYAYRHTKLRYNLLKSNKPWQCEDCRSEYRLQAHHIHKTRYLKNPSGHYYQDPSSDHSISNGRIYRNRFGGYPRGGVFDSLSSFTTRIIFKKLLTLVKLLSINKKGGNKDE